MNTVKGGEKNIALHSAQGWEKLQRTQFTLNLQNNNNKHKGLSGGLWNSISKKMC